VNKPDFVITYGLFNSRIFKNGQLTDFMDLYLTNMLQSQIRSMGVKLLVLLTSIDDSKIKHI
jgi:hypothetical protein